ncbi:MAG TPA: hypothetical protein VEU96_09740 [Bryobacteraceae bacterium]|nr:hypothetical protein [Bryobacteraceae bacterium]
MTRIVYRGLLWLHPSAFRRQFADEMLWIFDETHGTEAVTLLLSDVLISLARQWLLRSGAWKVAVAAAGGLIQLVLGGFGHMLVWRMHAVSRAGLDAGVDRLDLTRLIYIATGVLGGVMCSVIALTLWLRNFIGRRI